jgi:hypothetical protein
MSVLTGVLKYVTFVQISIQYVWHVIKTGTYTANSVWKPTFAKSGGRVFVFFNEDRSYRFFVICYRL